MEVLHHGVAFMLDLVIHFDRLEELLGYADKRVLRPFVEPIDRAAVDERGEHPDPGPEGITNG